MDRTERCKRIAAAVETLSQTEVEELFRMIHKHRFDYTRNNHGVFINLTWVPEHALKQMEAYIEFCHQSKHELRKYESICDALNTKLDCNVRGDAATKKEHKVYNNHAHLHHHSTSLYDHNHGCTTSADAAKPGKMSASMRFYLLKKKYGKVSTVSNNLENELAHDCYVIAA